MFEGNDRVAEHTASIRILSGVTEILITDNFSSKTAPPHQKRGFITALYFSAVLPLGEEYSNMADEDKLCTCLNSYISKHRVSKCMLTTPLSVKTVDAAIDKVFADSFTKLFGVPSTADLAEKVSADEAKKNNRTAPSESHSPTPASSCSSGDFSPCASSSAQSVVTQLVASDPLQISDLSEDTGSCLEPTMPALPSMSTPGVHIPALHGIQGPSTSHVGECEEPQRRFSCDATQVGVNRDMVSVGDQATHQTVLTEPDNNFRSDNGYNYPTSGNKKADDNDTAGWSDTGDEVSDLGNTYFEDNPSAHAVSVSDYNSVVEENQRLKAEQYLLLNRRQLVVVHHLSPIIDTAETIQRTRSNMQETSCVNSSLPMLLIHTENDHFRPLTASAAVSEIGTVRAAVISNTQTAIHTSNILNMPGTSAATVYAEGLATTAYVKDAELPPPLPPLPALSTPLSRPVLQNHNLSGAPFAPLSDVPPEEIRSPVVVQAEDPRYAAAVEYSAALPNAGTENIASDAPIAPAAPPLSEAERQAQIDAMVAFLEFVVHHPIEGADDDNTSVLDNTTVSTYGSLA